MKFFRKSVVASLVLVVPALALAQQQDAPIQRAEVRAELLALEGPGYTPGYPSSVPAAAGPLAATPQRPDAQTTGYGSSSSGSFQVGRPASSSTTQSVYFGL